MMVQLLLFNQNSETSGKNSETKTAPIVLFCSAIRHKTVALHERPV